MALVLNGKGLLLEGSNPKIEDISRFQVYVYNIPPESLTVRP